MIGVLIKWRSNFVRFVGIFASVTRFCGLTSITLSMTVLSFAHAIKTKVPDSPVAITSVLLQIMCLIKSVTNCTYK